MSSRAETMRRNSASVIKDPIDLKAHEAILAKKRKPEAENLNNISVKQNFDSLDALLKEHIDENISDDEDDDVDPDQPTPRVLEKAKSSTHLSRAKSKLCSVREIVEQEKEEIEEPATESDDERSTKKTKYVAQAATASNSSEPVMKPSKSPKQVARSMSATKIQGQSRHDGDLGYLDFIQDDRYLHLNMAGSGSYGKVFKSLDKSTDTPVAIKVIENVFHKLEDSKRIFREIFLLRRLNNAYIIKLLDVIVPKDIGSSFGRFNKLALIFDYVDTDLFRLVRSNQFLKLNHVQFIMFQLLNALNYLHANKVVHRDLKPANVLIFSNCKIKICDFGLARVIDDQSCVKEDIRNLEAELIDKPGDPEVEIERKEKEKEQKLKKKLTKHVVTRWYRAPELILLLSYNTKIDIWSAGCILGELLQMIHTPITKRTALFPGKSCFPLTAEHDQVFKNKTDQLNEIFKVIGTPSSDDMEGLDSVKGYLMSLESKEPISLPSIFPGIHQSALDLLRMLLLFNPDKRASAQDSLLTDFFQMKKKFPVAAEICKHDLSACEEQSTQKVTVDGYKSLIIRESLNKLS